MNICKRFAKIWFLGLLLVAVVAGCARNGEEILIIPDTTAPTVSFTSPANGDVAVPFDRKVSVAFSEAMAPLTINAASFTLTGPGGTVVPGTVAPVGPSATFTPTSPLAFSTTYTAVIAAGVKDLAGNAMASNYAWSFTTGAAADTTRPTVSFTAPFNGQTAVPSNRILQVAFSEAMDPLTINAASFTLTRPGLIPFTVTNVSGAVTAVGPSATFTPTVALAFSTTYTATITTAVKDLAGNTLASNFVWSFTTGVAADTSAPTVSFTAPVNGQTAVPVNRVLHVAFSEAMNPLTLTTATFTLTGPGVTSISGAVILVGSSATFTPTSPLANNTTYTATITTGARDLAGNALASNFVWSFTTSAAADTTSPTVSFTAPLNGAVAVPVNRIVHVAFSEAMNPLTLTTVTFTLTGPGVTPVLGTVTSVGPSAIFTPTSALANSTTYTGTITNGVRDLAGNALASNFVWSFTTGAAADTTSPTVSFTSPTNGAVAVPLNRKVNVAFSEAMDPLTLTTATFTLTGPGLTPVAGTVTPLGTTATFTPTSNLASNTLYTGTITTGAKDLAGNALASNFVWTFTTGLALDTTAPLVISTIPLDLATGVATNSIVTGTFSEAMDPLTISTATFSLKATVGSINVPGAVTYDAASKTATFTPLSNLANSTNYTATIVGGIVGTRDLAGNALVVDKVWTFTTGAAADTTPPTIILVNPLNLATGVALNSSVNATFSEAMDPLTLNTATFSLKDGLIPVAGLVSYNVASNIATFSPTANLLANTTYTATITIGAKDLAGNALAADYVWIFTTALVIPPVVPLIDLGSAAGFGIMATSAITNTGAATMINGDVSLDPGTSNGLLPVQVNGTIHINDTVSAQARVDLLAAYNTAKGLAPGTTISGGADLGALFPLGIPPGTYTSGSTMLVSTPLTLDAGGNANATWVFQIGSSLTTGASVSLANGAQAKNVFWVPTLDATIGVGTIFYGTIVTGRDATAVTGTVINGRILAGATLAGTIALQTTTVNVPAP